MPSAEQVEGGGVGTEPEAEPATSVGAGGVERTLERSPDLMQNDADSANRCGIGTEDAALCTDGLGGEGG